MNTYILVSFVMLVVGFFGNALAAALGAFPVKVEHGLGYFLGAAILRIPFLIWGAYLLWGGA
jgi:hypothetical protein